MPAHVLALHHADAAVTVLKSLGVIGQDVEINVRTESLTKLDSQINTIESTIEGLRGQDGTLNLDSSEVQAALTVYQALVRQRNELDKPVIAKVTIDEKTTDPIEKAVLKLQELQSLLAERKEVKFDVSKLAEVDTKIQGVLKDLNDIDDETLISLGFNASGGCLYDARNRAEGSNSDYACQRWY